MTGSTQSAAPPKPTKSRNSNSSVQIQTRPKSEFEFELRDTEESEFSDLMDFGDSEWSSALLILVL